MIRSNRRAGAGALDQTVSVVAVTEAPDGRGGYTTTEATVATVPAHVESTRGQETVIADQQRGVVSYRLTARNEGQWAALSVGSKLTWNDRTLNVRMVPDEGRELYLTVTAEQGVVNS